MNISVDDINKLMGGGNPPFLITYTEYKGAVT